MPTANATGTTGPRAQDRTTRRLVILVVGTGTLLSALTVSSINLALPDVGGEFSVTVDLSGWVISGFLLSLAAVLLSVGRLADIAGHRLVYLLGFAIFGLSSLACGFAPGLSWLVGARVIQGVGAAMIIATGPALLTSTYPDSERGSVLGMLMTATYVGLTIGPPVGGWVIAVLGWRWIFFMMVPVSVLVVTLGLILLPRVRVDRTSRFDWASTMTIVPGLPLCLLAMARGHQWGWSSPWTLGSAALGMLLLVVFFVLQARMKDPLVGLDLFGSRVFTLSSLAATGQYVAIFCYVILLPYYLVEALEMDTAHAGLVLAAQPLAMSVVSTPSGRLSDRVGTRWLSVGGLVVLAAGLGGLSTVGASTSPVVVSLWLAVVGLGTGVFISPNSSAIMGSAPATRQGVAGGMIAVARSLGMMVGVALSTAVFRIAGGVTGKGAWTQADHRALSIALGVSAVIVLVCAALAAAGGELRDIQQG